MDQVTFSDLEYEHKKRKTRREKFLDRMDGLIPWDKLEKKIRRYYPKAGRGRHPYPLRVMLRIHCVQLFYNMSDPAMEDMLYEIDSVRRFVGLKITGPIPDETTILKFRHLLETHDLGAKLFAEINGHLESQGLILKEGTIVDASLISAPSSTKNQTGQRDPEMHQTKKGNEWYFGMKMHIGVDADVGMVHTLSTTAANVSDIAQAAHVLHGEEERVYGDAGYQGIEKRGEHQDREVDWQIAMRPGKRAVLRPGCREAKREKRKASVRAKVEHPFRYVKVVFDYAKVRYRGLHKNTERIALLLGFTNLLIADRYETA
jgi:IS5 family transposase